MLRLVFGLIGLGGVLAFIGYQEYKVSEGTSKAPVAVSLAKLEHGIDPPNNHIEIGEHVAVWDALIYEYEQTASDPTGDKPETKVNFVYYPVVSGSHTLAQKIEELNKRDPDSITQDEIDELSKEKFKVLVRTSRFKTVGAVPEGGIEKQEKVKGLVVNQISSLGWEERRLLKDSFPELDVKEVLILQEGREPASATKSFGLMGGGGVLILVGLGLIFFCESF